MVMDIWCIEIISYAATQEGPHGAVAESEISAEPLRILRLLKLTRVARLMKAFPELVTMIKGLVRSMRAIFSTLILVLLQVYVWGIIMHMLLKDDEEFNSRMLREIHLQFNTIGNCMWALLVDGTLMMDGPYIMTSLLYSDQPKKVIAGLFFLSYTLLSALLILQMLIGVLCDVVTMIQEEQKDAEAIGLVKQEIIGAFKDIDNGDGMITQSELLELLTKPRSKAILKKLNINRLFLMELQKTIYSRREDTRLPISQVLELLIKCRGDNSATIESIAGGFSYLAQEVRSIVDEAHKRSFGAAFPELDFENPAMNRYLSRPNL
jgi:hypothetical protein